MLLREDDGALSPLAKVVPMLGFYGCTREDGSFILAAAEDLVEE